MTAFVHELISNQASESPKKTALRIKDEYTSYQELNDEINQVAQSYSALNVQAGERIGLYLPKNIEYVQAMFACSLIGAVFVPINPVLKAQQAYYIANNCQLKILITNKARVLSLLPLLPTLVNLTTIVVIDGEKHSLSDINNSTANKLITWQHFKHGKSSNRQTVKGPEHSSQLAAIFYTSGSTGQPKGIQISHQNIVLGAKAVSQYLTLSAEDIILAILPLSFDYGLNQLTSAFFVGATCVLHNYLLANDVIKAIDYYQITGIAAVPPLWGQLMRAHWPTGGAKSVRYFTNSGGILPAEILTHLRQRMPCAAPFLMYGLTEAFRSSYLPPEEINRKVGSIGKAIPFTELLVIGDNGEQCKANEVGELVHVGPLVTLGYWQNNAATKVRFRPVPKQAINRYNTKVAVYSGDYVKFDNDGFLYFITRKDNMIKTSGYRVSPHEIESVLLQIENVVEAAIISAPCKDVGQIIVAIVVLSKTSQVMTSSSIIRYCQRHLANYMLPKKVIFVTDLPRNANGKIDIAFLQQRYGNHTN